MRRVFYFYAGSYAFYETSAGGAWNLYVYEYVEQFYVAIDHFKYQIHVQLPCCIVDAEWGCVEERLWCYYAGNRICGTANSDYLSCVSKTVCRRRDGRSCERIKSQK